MDGEAWSVYLLPSAVSNSELMSLIHSFLSILFSTFTWTPTMVLPSWSTVTTLTTVPEATGLLCMVKPRITTTMAITAAAISTGTIGGRVHLARSSSSDMGTWPASVSVAGVDDPGLGAGAGLGVSGIG